MATLPPPGCWPWRSRYDKLLSTILIGNNIVNIAAASIGTVLFTKVAGCRAGRYGVHYGADRGGADLRRGNAQEPGKGDAGDGCHRSCASAQPADAGCLPLLTWLFSQWKRLLGHFVHSTEEDTITEGELMTMVSEAENDGELTDRESQLIRSAIEFDDVEGGRDPDAPA